jgi:hypothetical protein
MAKQKLTDAEAKSILRNWPERTKSLWPASSIGGFWLRALPKDGVATCPHLQSPGATLFTTQPDGLYLFLSENTFADAVSLEVCGTIQNLNDKRSRYMPSSHSIVAVCPLVWLVEEIDTQKGGKSARWAACKSISNAPQAEVSFPIRHLRVMYALPNVDFDDWCKNHTPTGYEYFCKHSTLDSFTSQSMQRFLSQMSMYSHFLGKIT